MIRVFLPGLPGL
jgi:hypothetical protein